MGFPHRTATLKDLSTRGDEGLRHRADRGEMLVGIWRGLVSMERQEGAPARLVLESIRKKYNIPKEA